MGTAKELSNQEKWREVPGYEKMYEVSNFGRVRSLDRFVPGKHENLAKIKGKVLTPIKNKGGYLRVNLCNEYGHKAMFVHRLVAQAFIENPEGFSDVNHKDENPTNNCLSNLEWCSAKYNANYGTRNERVSRSNRGRRKKYTHESFRRMVASKEKAVIGTNCSTNEQVWFQSISSAKEYGFSPVGISHCITNRQKTHRGYTWRVA